MIDFELPTPIQRQIELVGMLGEQIMRPVARYYDEHEGERPWDYINMIWQTIRQQGGRTLALPKTDDNGGNGQKAPGFGNLMLVHNVEALSWGDAGLYLSTPGGGLGGAAVEATGTPDQRARFLLRFREGEPKWAAMAMTEPQAGSDTAAIRTTARLSEDGKEWIINGEKIFVTGGLMAAKESTGFVVVWATVDPSAGRAGMKPFVVEAGTPGMTVAKLEHKHGIRASDTAALVFQDCRIPYDNLLGSAEVARPGSSAGEAGRKGFKGAMKTFDATRPAVAASALGITRASLEFTAAYLKERGVQVRYGVPLHRQTAIERDLLQMEAQHRAAWLLVLKAAASMDAGEENTLEASMCKVKAGAVANFVAQKAVELLGPEGYSCKLLVEKWMRDARINDIYEGTGQINRLVVARRLLGYSSKELR